MSRDRSELRPGGAASITSSATAAGNTDSGHLVTPPGLKFSNSQTRPVVEVRDGWTLAVLVDRI
jgi:hypothetical protein